MASTSPAEEIFSDTMELTKYLHRRVQEVGNKFRRSLFKSIIDESHILSPGLSPSHFQPAIANSRSGCSSTKLRNDAAEGDSLQSIPQEKHSSHVGFPEAHLPCFKECVVTTHQYEIGPGVKTNGTSADLHNDNGLKRSMTFEKMNLSSKEDEDLTLVHMAHLGLKKFRNPFRCLDVVDTQDLEGNTMVIPCFDTCRSMAPIEAQGILPQSSVLCSTPTCESFEDKRGTPCHPVHHSEKLSMSLKLPSHRDHGMLDPEDGRTKVGDFTVHGWPPVSEGIVTCEAASQKQPDTGTMISKESYVVDRDFQDIKLSSACVGVETSTLLPCSLSSVDSSECDNCKLDVVRGHVITNISSTEDKRKELDARSEVGCLEIYRKDGNDEEGKMVAKAGEVTAGVEKETKNEAWDLLLDAIQVTSGEELVGLRPCPSKEDDKDGELFGPTKEAFEVRVFHRTRKGQPHLLGRVNGSGHVHTGSCQDVARNIIELPAKRICRRPKVHAKAIPTVSAIVRFKSLKDVSEMEEKRTRISSEREEHLSNQGMRLRHTKHPDGHKNMEHMISGICEARDVKEEEKQRPRRARSQVLPDSVLQPWKKREK